MRTVFITGIRGFLGSQLEAYLASRSYRVVGSVGSAARPHSAPEGSRFVLALGEPVDTGVFAGVDVVIHCAHDFRPGSLQRNVEGTRRIAEAARRAGVSQQVFLSSYSARSNATSEYGRAKYAIHHLCLAMNLTVLRPGLVVGPGGLFGRMAAACKSSPVVPLIDGGRAQVWVLGLDNFLEAMGTVLRSSRTGLFNLFNSEPVSLRTLLQEVKRAGGYHSVFAPVPARLMLCSVWCASKLGVKLPISTDSILGLMANQGACEESDLPRLVARVQTIQEMVHVAVSTVPRST